VISAVAVLFAVSPSRWLEHGRVEASARDELPRRAERGQPPPLPPGMRVVQSFRLRPPGGGKARGVAVIGRLRGRLAVSVLAWELRPIGAEKVYAVWLFNSQRDALTLGAQRANSAGELVGTGPLPRRFRGLRRYRFLDVSVEPVRGPRGHSGDSVLRGRIPR
jgi:hypothetical protein